MAVASGPSLTFPTARCFRSPCQFPGESVMPSGVVFVVGDDPSVRASLKFLISTVGLQVETVESAESALQKLSPEAPSCLVLDVRLRGLSGLDLQGELAARKCQVPIVFITGHGDIR